ncbi:hypothetical protein BDW59DRAFT_162972 [Aspergillus cavernicola]|uniref:Uncharacterized protein n=1 Tax=Aspergillus cavernicola TaxID=176166 RepID=A0ABR4I847_9EURO
MGDCVLRFPNNLTEATRLGALMEPGMLITDASNEESFNIDDDHRYRCTLPDLLEWLLNTISIGMYRAPPFDQVDLNNNPWIERPNYSEVIPWSEYILNKTLEAYEALVQAITARIPQHQHQHQQQDERHTPSPTPTPTTSIATEDTLPPEIQGFPRALLLDAFKPSFTYIAQD